MPASSRQLRRRTVRRLGRVSRQRRGNAFTFSLVAVCVVAGVAFAGWWLFGRERGKVKLDLIHSTVSMGPYDYVVIEQGTVESGTNTELRCNVRVRGGGGGGGSSGGGGSTTIMEVVPEGSMVQAGDVVVRLDSSVLDQERITQQTKVNSQEAICVQAENTLAAAKIAREEYEKGTYVQDEKLIQSDVFVAEQNRRTAEGALNAAKVLASKGIITGLQVEGAQFTFENANKQLELAQTKLATLRDYTRSKMLKQFDSDIATAESKVKTEQSNLRIEQDKLEDIQAQIAECTIKAPRDGQVVYANQYDSWRGSSQAEFVVAPGVAVRERQVLIRLPNPQDMQVKATVNEARINLIRPGLPVTIRVDALKDEVIQGEVTKVNPYAEPGSYSSGNIRKYGTQIKILNPPPGLRVGMNAEARIHVERQNEALQVPVQALAEHKGHFFSLVQNGASYRTVEVKINSTNDKVATIGGGLVEGDQVVMNPRAAGDLLVLPALPDPTPAQIAEVKRVVGAPVIVPGGEAPPGGTGGAGGPGAKGKRKGGGFNPVSMVDLALQENDTNKDGQISTAEMDGMDDRRKQMLGGADANKDGFLDRAEMLSAAGAFAQQMREKGGGNRGGEGSDPERPSGGGPAGGGQ